MKLSGGVEWAIHCCVVLSRMDGAVPAGKLAGLHDVSSSYLAKQMQALSRGGLVRSLQGHAGGYVLTRPADQISILDVVQAVEGKQPLFVCTEIRQRGPLGTPPEKCLTHCPIAIAMMTAETAWRDSLNKITIGDLAHQVSSTSGPETFQTIQHWFAGATVP
ncbi:RrF2 family transcriptional regulator [Pseudarthrobacter chlorophenolicus]|nr:Rrf2 family transcriptional regulator [Pseudarthrobacter chlorophenolicus]